jgi:hypothetical protein
MNLAKIPLLGVVLLLCLASLGCGAKEVRVEDKIVGAWQGRFEIDQAAVDQRLETAEDVAQKLMLQAAVATMSDANAAFNIELKADGTFQSKWTAANSTTESSGTWQIKSVEGSKVTLVTTEKETSHEHALTLAPDFLAESGGFSMPAPGPLADLGVLKFQRL